MGLFIGKVTHIMYPPSHWRKLLKEYPSDRVVIPLMLTTTQTQDNTLHPKEQSSKPTEIS